tara:strand:- start:372 stop:671 length:300 start_codon:yes stop_codon:yes gene_type:complete
MQFFTCCCRKSILQQEKKTYGLVDVPPGVLLPLTTPASSTTKDSVVHAASDRQCVNTASRHTIHQAQNPVADGRNSPSPFSGDNDLFASGQEYAGMGGP